MSLSIRPMISVNSPVHYNDTEVGTVIALGTQVSNAYRSASPETATHAFILDFFENTYKWVPLERCQLHDSQAKQKRQRAQSPNPVRSSPRQAASATRQSQASPRQAASATRQSQARASSATRQSQTSPAQKRARSGSAQRQSHSSSAQTTPESLSREHLDETPLILKEERKEAEEESFRKRLQRSPASRFLCLDEIPGIDIRNRIAAYRKDAFAKFIKDISEELATKLNCEYYADTENWKNFSGLPVGYPTDAAVEIILGKMNDEKEDTIQYYAMVLGFAQVFNDLSLNRTFPKSNMRRSIAIFLVNPHPMNLLLPRNPKRLDEISPEDNVNLLARLMECLGNPDDIKDNKMHTFRESQINVCSRLKTHDGASNVELWRMMRPVRRVCEELGVVESQVDKAWSEFVFGEMPQKEVTFVENTDEQIEDYFPGNDDSDEEPNRDDTYNIDDDDN